jgi:putative iron-only hydrogenase system regulator
MENRVGVIGIIITDREKQAHLVNEVLADFGEIIVGRMGIPYREKNISVLSLIVDGDTDTLGALTGRLGSIPGVKVRSALIPTEPRRTSE